MIGQYLSQTNENTTVPKSKIFLELKKAYVGRSGDDFLEKRMFVAVFNWAIPPYTAESGKDMSSTIK